MYKPILYSMIILLFLSCHTAQHRTTKEKIDRVEIARIEKEPKISAILKQYNLQKENLHILLVAYKNLDELQLYAKNSDQDIFQKIQSFPICQRSGVLGPKKAEGDKQVPEGLYHIDRFNPESIYFLSLGLNYPNELDKSLGYTGSDIFIHGKCETVGCLPMTDDLIKEIYLYATAAKNAGQEKIPVYIFPFEMTESNIQQYQKEDATDAFWKNLQEGYQLFKTNNKELQFSVSNGKYIFH